MKFTPQKVVFMQAANNLWMCVQRMLLFFQIKCVQRTKKSALKARLKPFSQLFTTEMRTAFTT